MIWKHKIMLMLIAMTIARQGCWLTITISQKSTSGIRSCKVQRKIHLQMQNMSFTSRFKPSGMLHHFLHILILQSANCKVFLPLLVSKDTTHAGNEVMQLGQNCFCLCHTVFFPQLPKPIFALFPGGGCLIMDIEQQFDNDRYLRKVGVPGEI